VNIGASTGRWLIYLLILGLVFYFGFLLSPFEFEGSKQRMDPYSTEFMIYPSGFDEQILYQDQELSSTVPPLRGQRLDGGIPTEPSNSPQVFNPNKEDEIRTNLDFIRQFEKGSDFQLRKTRDGKYFKVTFEMLSGFEFNPDFDFIMGKTANRKKLIGRVPDRVIELNDEPIVIIGFMVPIQLDMATMKVRSFALTQNIAYCCYGIMPNLHELLIAEMAGDREARFYDNVPVAVFGTLSVGEAVDRAQMVSFYRLKVVEVLHIKELLRRVDR